LSGIAGGAVAVDGTLVDVEGILDVAGGGTGALVVVDGIETCDPGTVCEDVSDGGTLVVRFSSFGRRVFTATFTFESSLEPRKAKNSTTSSKTPATAATGSSHGGVPSRRATTVVLVGVGLTTSSTTGGRADIGNPQLGQAIAF